MLGNLINNFMVFVLQHIPMIVVHITVVAGIIIYLIGEFVPLIPITYKLGLRVLAVIVFSLGMILEGAVSEADIGKTNLVKAEEQIQAINEQAAAISQQVKTVYVTKTKVIKEKGDEITKYITVDNNKSCTLFNSTIELWDAAAENRIPSTTARTDDSPSTVSLSNATGAIVYNYTTYNQVAAELSSLQQWVAKQQKNNP